MYEELIDTLQIGKHTFKVYVAADDTGRLPWEDDCIFEDVVSDWTRNAKRPWQRTLSEDRGSRRHFDVRQYIKVAKAQGCTGAQAAEQLERSFGYLRRFCADQWSYVGVIVKRVDAEGEELESDSLWGIESDATDYIAEVARDMAQDMAPEADKERARAAYARRKESAERRYWAQRDVVTV